LTALEVEQVLGVCEVSVHTLTGLLAELGPYTGAAVDREWGLVLVVDLRRIWAPREEPILSFEGPRILVVDDSQTVRALSASALEAAGYDVDLAADGLEALQLLHKERYDLLLTDVEMPRLDGLGLLERLRAEPRLSRLPVVILTSRPGDVARGRASELGVRALLQKPVTATRLVREVTAALERG
jgi:CheY-like chemotaxis protein